MDGNEAAVARHYQRSDLAATILDALERTGKRLDALTPDTLAPLDHFHGGGLATTRTLAELAGVADLDPGGDGLHVLDVGCGIGGPARYLAHTFGCRVTGIDLTEAYCEVAALLSERMGLGARTTFRQASALALPFPDASFHLVWTQNAQMNIADKSRFYREITRVLKPGGRLACTEVLQGPAGTLHLPVPWASAAALNHLITPEALRRLLADLGFRERHWVDITAHTLAGRRKALAGLARTEPPPLGVHLLMGPDAPERQRNSLRNAEEGRAVMVQAVLDRES